MPPLLGFALRDAATPQPKPCGSDATDRAMDAPTALTYTSLQDNCQRSVYCYIKLSV